MPTDGYLPPQIEVDPDALTQRGLDAFAERFPNVELGDASLLLWDLETDALTAADIGNLILDVGEWIVTRTLGVLLNEPQRLPVAATGTATFQVRGDTAITIDAGMPLEATNASGDPVPLEVLQSVAVPQGQTTVPGVPVQAIEEGLDGNGATGLVLGPENFPWGISATMDGPTTGGSDGEEDDTYLSRLVQLRTLVKPTPITAESQADYVRLTVEGVGRAVALDNTRPGPPVETGVAGAVTIGIAAADGTQPDASVRTAAQGAINAAIESSAQAYVVTADYTAISVEATVYSWPGYDHEIVRQECVDLITAYLSPDAWGAPPTRGDNQTGTAPRWYQQTTVRVAEIIEQLGRAQGVDYSNRTTLKVGKAGTTLTNSDYTMTGLLPLPLPGTITVTVIDR